MTLNSRQKEIKTIIPRLQNVNKVSQPLDLDDDFQLNDMPVNVRIQQL